MKRHALVVSLLFLSGCASYYNAPGRGADMSIFGCPASQQAALTDPSVAARLDARPAASLPTVLAIAHVQGDGYSSYNCRSYGTGRYSVVTTLDAEKPEDIERLRKLPLVRDVALMNPLVLSREMKTDLDLRAAAGTLHADMLLVYTFDTTFRTEDFASPLTVVTLGLFPSKTAKVTTTASAVLLDTRTGYVFGTSTGSSKQSQLANSWTTRDAADDARVCAEREALGQVLTEFERMWQRLILDSPNWSRAAGPRAAPVSADPVFWQQGAPAGNTYWTVPRR